MMKALMKNKKEPGNVGMMEAEEPPLNERSVLIQIQAAGVYHSDFLLINWGPTMEKEYRPPLTLVMGHEYSGRVLKVGSRGKGFKAKMEILLKESP